MRLLHWSLVLGLILLVGCSGGQQGVNSDNSTERVDSTNAAGKSTDEVKAGSASAGVPQKGGQVIESGPYHLEFVAVKETNGTHLDFYLQKGDNHEAIPNAQVTVQVQLPDSTQKTFPLSYDAEGKHYAAVLPYNLTGQYQVKVSSKINGETVDGRFSFSR